MSENKITNDQLKNKESGSGLIEKLTEFNKKMVRYPYALHRPLSRNAIIITKKKENK